MYSTLNLFLWMKCFMKKYILTCSYSDLFLVFFFSVDSPELVGNSELKKNNWSQNSPSKKIQSSPLLGRLHMF